MNVQRHFDNAAWIRALQLFWLSLLSSVTQSRPIPDSSSHPAPLPPLSVSNHIKTLGLLTTCFYNVSFTALIFFTKPSLYRLSSHETSYLSRSGWLQLGKVLNTCCENISYTPYQFQSSVGLIILSPYRIYIVYIFIYILLMAKVFLIEIWNYIFSFIDCLGGAVEAYATAVNKVRFPDWIKYYMVENAYGIKTTFVTGNS